MNIYYAAPLFTHASQDYNAKVVELLRNEIPNVSIYLPQENEAINDKSGYADSLMIADGDNSRLLSSDLLIAHIDGQEIDAGVASEIGIAWAKEIPIIGLYTDVRQSGLFHNDEKIKALDLQAENQYDYKNLYTIGLIKQRGKIAKDSAELLELVKEEIKAYSTKYFIQVEGEEPKYMDSLFIPMMISEMESDTMIERCVCRTEDGIQEFSFCTAKEIYDSLFG